MLSFKGYIVEETQALDAVKGIINSLTGFDAESVTHNSDKSTRRRYVVTAVFPDKQRKEFVIKANAWIKDTNGYTSVDLSSGRAGKDVLFKMDGFEKDIYIQTKPNGARGRTDPNELMTAVIACMDTIDTPTSIEELDTMIDKAKALVPTKVFDYAQKELDAFDYEYSNFCQAISAAKAIKDHIGGTPDKAYVTGRTWHRDISKFKINAYGMKDFNSSDIVFKKDELFYGVSLKKKKLPTTADPTLLNKALDNLLSTDQLQKDYREAVDVFLDKVIVAAQKEGMVNDADFRNRKNARTRKKIITGLDEEWMGKQLRAVGSIFTSIANILNKDADIIAEKLIQLIFKLDLQQLKDHGFNFSLVTGIGDYGPRKGPDISDADVYALDRLALKVHDLLAKGAPKIKLDRTSTQPGQPGASAATLKCILKIGRTPVVNIAIRYKGSASWASQPSVTGTFTREFKNIMKDK